MTKLLVVSDSCSLILLTRAKLLDIVCKEFSVEIPSKIFEEVVIVGKELNKVDAFIIEKKIKTKKIFVKEISLNKLNELIQFNLDKGEEEAIMLSIQDNADFFLADDKQAINTAKFLGINWISIPILIQSFYEKKKINQNDAFEALSIVQREGRYKLDFILEVLKNIGGKLK